MSRDDNQVDVQAQKILLGLSELEKLLDKPNAGEALDLTKNARTTEQFTVMRRLRKSLGQYLNRRNDLLYVGFIGHFSSGKSSTINSILRGWGTGEERETDLNPTDTTITLITAEHNYDSLLGVIKEGHVTIRFNAVENSLLERVVLVDTPGSGDTQFVEEVARDFLPICDVLFFFLSASSPLDKTDLPLLSEINKRLRFIPMKYIVTRSDEFRTDFDAPLSSDNYDISKRNRFLSQVVTRLNSILHPTITTDDQFFFIDNKRGGFQIESLREYIVKRCDPLNSMARISMHGHKMNYYRTTATDLRRFFAAFLDLKLQELGKIVTAAESNITKYNDNVKLSSENLSRGWTDRLSSINLIRTSMLRRFHQDEVIPSNIDAFQYVYSRKSDAIKLLSEDAKHVAHQVVTRFNESITENLKKRMQDIRYWDAILVDESEDGQLETNRFLVSFDSKSLLPIIPGSILGKWAALRENRATSVRDAATKLRTTVSAFAFAIESKYAISDLEKIVESARQAIEVDLTLFFRNAELYRDGVFSHNTKESISTLGIGGRLDALEAEFTEGDKKRFVEEATQNLFPGTEDAVNIVTGRLSQLSNEMRGLTSELSHHDMRVPSPTSIDLEMEHAIEEESSATLSAIVVRLQDDTDRLFGGIRLKVAAAIAIRRRKFKDDIRRAKRRRLLRYLSFCLGGFAISAFGVSFYFLHWQPAADMFFSVLGNLIAELVAVTVSFFLAKWIDDFPVTTSRIREDARGLMSAEVFNIVEEDFRCHEFLGLGEAHLSQLLMASYSKLLVADPDGWSEIVLARANLLRKHEADFHRFRTEFENDACTFMDRIDNFFNDPKKNIGLLNKVADKVKDKAIEPSFDLLRSTRSSLEDVKNQIQSVVFD